MSDYPCEHCEYAQDCSDVPDECAYSRGIMRKLRDEKRDGSIIEGGGVSRPEWMDDDQWAEYKMSAEYANEVKRS